MFDIYNPSPDDLYEVLQRHYDRAVKRPKQLYTENIIKLKPLDHALLEENIGHLANSIKYVQMKANLRTQGGHIEYKLKHKHYYDDNDTYESETHGWVDLIYLNTVFIPNLES